MTHFTSCRLETGRNLLFLLAATLLSVGIFGCGDEDITGGNTARWDATPSSVSFSQVPIGQVGTQVVSITNVGGGTLSLRDVKLSDDSASAFSIEGSCLSTEALEENESCGLTVTYEPFDEQSHSGVITMNTNDPTIEGLARIPITTQGVGGELFVNPPAVNFHQTPADSFDYEYVEIYNVGAAPLHIEEIFVSSGANIFEVSFPEERTADMDSDGDTHPAVLEHNDDPILLRVTFRPEDWDPAFGTIMIITNDPFDPEYELDLRGNSGDTCLEVSHPDGVDFGLAAMGMDNKEVITLRNCSPTADLELNNIEVISTGGGVFGVDETFLPGDLASGGNKVLEPGEITTAHLNFHPTDETTYNGELLIASDDSRDPELVLPLTGQGVDAMCPDAVAVGSVGGTVASPTVHAAPQDVVNLSGAGSNDPDGTSISYEWAVIQRPDGSLADVDSPFSENTTLELDIVGEFLVELTVTDGTGLTNCEPAIVQIFATPQEDIHVQLVWSTPTVNQNYGGPNGDAGIGVDLDLHYVHPDAYWGDSLSVNWLQRTGSWGQHGEVSLDIDDWWGEDPENINHADPMNGAFYRVGVHYYDDKGYGATDATVRIYYGIDLYGQYERRLHATDNFWYVGNVQWNPTDPYFDFIDQFQETIAEITSANDIFGP